jgi:hypothetical protein
MSAGDIIGIGAGIYSAKKGLEDADALTTYGSTLNSQLTNMGNELNSESAFKGYGVTSNLGQTTVSNNGSVDFGVGQNQGMMDAATGYQNAGTQMMNQSMQPTAGREQQIYDRAMAMQNPQLNRAQAAQQAREYAMGRGGVRGSQFGGTAEDAAMARARADASNQASFAAMQQAQQEQMQQANIANAYTQAAGQNYQNSFLPMQQQMNLMQQAQYGVDAAQTGQLTGLQYMAQLGLGGTQVDANAQNSAAQLKGNIYDSILDNAGGEGGLFSFL